MKVLTAVNIDNYSILKIRSSFLDKIKRAALAAL